MPVYFMVLSALGSGLLWIWNLRWAAAGTSQQLLLLTCCGFQAQGIAAWWGHRSSSNRWSRRPHHRQWIWGHDFLPPSPFSNPSFSAMGNPEILYPVPSTNFNMCRSFFSFFKQMSVKILCHKQSTALCLVSWRCASSSHLSLWSGNLNTRWNVNETHHTNTLSPKLRFGFIKGYPYTTNRLLHFNLTRGHPCTH